MISGACRGKGGWQQWRRRQTHRAGSQRGSGCDPGSAGGDRRVGVNAWMCENQSVKMSHIDTVVSHIDTVIFHIFHILSG